MTEIWKSLDGFSKYQFSNMGKVWSSYYQRELINKSKKCGYIMISLVNDKKEKKTYTLHRLIATAFIPNPEKKPTVNHKNHIRNDNKVSNLEWATITEQNNHSRKISKNKKRLVSARCVWRCSTYGEKIQLYDSIISASEWVVENSSKKYCLDGVSKGIIAVCKKRQKRCAKFIWEYDNSKKDLYDKEIWKDIPSELVKGSKGYKISDYGRVKNHRGRIQDGYIRADGYKGVSVGKQRKFILHRLVAKIFLPNFYRKPVVHHKDHDKTNCKLYNLQWVTYSENKYLANEYYKKN